MWLTALQRHIFSFSVDVLVKSKVDLIFLVLNGDVTSCYQTPVSQYLVVQNPSVLKILSVAAL